MTKVWSLHCFPDVNNAFGKEDLVKPLHIPSSYLTNVRALAFAVQSQTYLYHSSHSITELNNFSLTGGDKKGWVLLRASLHDPLLVLNVESDVEGGASKLAAQVHHRGFARLQPVCVSCQRRSADANKVVFCPCNAYIPNKKFAELLCIVLNPHIGCACAAGSHILRRGRNVRRCMRLQP